MKGIVGEKVRRQVMDGYATYEVTAVFIADGKKFAVLRYAPEWEYEYQDGLLGDECIVSYENVESVIDLNRKYKGVLKSA